MKTLTIAAAQLSSIPGDVRLNTEQHVKFIEVAASHESSLVVFSELSLTGYEPDLGESLAFTATDSRLKPLQDVSNATGSTVVAGAPIGIGSNLHIGAFIIEPHQVVKVYTKQHVTPSEARVFVPGEMNPLVDFSGESGAAAICADTTFPTHAANAAERGVPFYLAGVFFGPERISENRKQLSRYASQHSMTVVMANSGGPSSEFESAGDTSIWSPSGQSVVRVDGVGPALALARRSTDGWTGESISFRD